MNNTKAIIYGILRYLLGGILIAYATTKLLNTQFIILPFNVWQQPLEDVWGGSLAWAFLGYSSWFQTLLGLCELIPALFLLWRRTAFLGSILMLPLTLNVMLINLALHLWPQTQVLSIILFLLNTALLLFEWHKLHHVYIVILNKKNELLKTLPETLTNIGLIAFLLFIASYPLLQYRNQNNVLMGEWFNMHPNEWQLIKHEVNDSVVNHLSSKIYFMPYDEYLWLNDTIAFNKHEQLTYELDETKKELKLYPLDSTLQSKLYSYKIKNDSLLILQGNNETLTLKRRVMNTRYHQ